MLSYYERFEDGNCKESYVCSYLLTFLEHKEINMLQADGLECITQYVN